MKRKFDPDVPVIPLGRRFIIRWPSVKMRAGDKEGAPDLINTVRKRYFRGGTILILSRLPIWMEISYVG